MGSKTYRNSGRKPKRIDYIKFCECLAKFRNGEWKIDECASYCGTGKAMIAQRMLAAYEWQKKKMNPEYITNYSAGIPKEWFTEESIRQAQIVKTDSNGRIVE